MQLLKKQFEPVDNSPLIVFRIAFGFLLMCESFGAILTGWVNKALIEPDFNFTLIGLEWMQPPDGPFMHGYFIVMGICGLGVMLGFHYKLSTGLFTILWTGAYWMQKTHYNNHYYLLILICLFMLVVPANAYFSMDAKRNNRVVGLKCPRWCINIFIIQLWIIYTFAALHKFYPGWLEGDFIAMNFAGKKNLPIIGQWLQNEMLQSVVIYGGILFDGLILYFLMWKKTRKVAFVISLVFHLFNSIVFQIGIFPYLMIAICVLFFEPELIRKKFFKRKPPIDYHSGSSTKLAAKHYLILFLFGAYFIHQIYLPLRHHLYKGDVFYTEEGHRLSWRMMLRYKQGDIGFRAHSTALDSSWTINPKKYFTLRQNTFNERETDMIWQAVQHFKKDFQKHGIEDIQIWADSYVRLNGGEKYRLIDPSIDLASTKWQPLKHSPWILSPKKEK